MSWSNVCLKFILKKTQYLRHPETNHPWPEFLERNPFEAWRFDESSDLFLEMMQLQEKESSVVNDFFFPSLFPANSCSYRDSFFKYIWGLCYLGSLLVYQLSFLIYTHLQRGGGQTLAAKIADMADFSGTKKAVDETSTLLSSTTVRNIYWESIVCFLMYGSYRKIESQSNIYR